MLEHRRPLSSAHTFDESATTRAERFTPVGIGGPVGSGKTAAFFSRYAWLLRDRISLGVVTNDILSL